MLEQIASFLESLGVSKAMEQVSFLLDPVNILGADTRNIDGKAFGTMLLGLPDSDEEAARALAYIQAQNNISVEEVRDYHA